MSEESNKEKRAKKHREKYLSLSKMLGMSRTTARHRLYRNLIWDMFTKLHGRICYRCKGPLHNDDWHIDHIQPWAIASKPAEMYFNLENIALSHSKCNIIHGASLTDEDKKAA